jgi:hypothetical protein
MNQKFIRFRLLALVVMLHFFASIVGASSVYFTYNQRARNQLSFLINRIQDDISVKNGIWDMYKYNSDPILPGNESIYIFTTDGFVVDRWRPIKGFLDTSSISYLLDFTSPKTVSFGRNQFWRIYSKPVIYNNETLGVITSSYFQSNEENISSFDSKLKKNVETIFSQLKIQDKNIDVSDVDIRTTDLEIAIRVVDRFNSILVKSNNSNSIDRTPSYIDRSYVANQLKNTGFKQLADLGNNSPYLVLSTPFVVNGETVGLILVAQSVSVVYDQLRVFFSIQLAVLFIILIISWLAIRRYSIHELPVVTVKKIFFQSSTGNLTINNTIFEISKDSFQYKLIKAIFNEPEKKFKAIEILNDISISDSNAWRKVYDSSVLLNKRVFDKLNGKLIISDSAEFYLNPDIKAVIEQ